VSLDPIFYKVLWLIVVAYPLWSTGALAGSAAEGTTAAFLWWYYPSWRSRGVCVRDVHLRPKAQERPRQRVARRAVVAPLRFGRMLLTFGATLWEESEVVDRVNLIGVAQHRLVGLEYF